MAVEEKRHNPNYGTNLYNARHSLGSGDSVVYDMVTKAVEPGYMGSEIYS